MKKGIHPDYMDCTITCSCGNVIKTRSTKPEISVELCSACHPFYTGQQKLVDTGGRVQRFANKFGDSTAKAALEREQKRKAEAAKKAQEAEEERKAERQRKAEEKARRSKEYELANKDTLHQEQKESAPEVTKAADESADTNASEDNAKSEDTNTKEAAE